MPGSAAIHSQPPEIMKDKEDYINGAKAALDELNLKVDSLEHKLVDSKIEASANWQSKLNDLKLKRQEVRHKLEALQNASDDSWQSIKDLTENVLDDLRNTYAEVKDKLTSAVS